MFKNARLYRLASPFELSATALAEQLATRRFRPCGPIETATLGWCPAAGDDDAALVHALSGCLLLRARKQERLLPTAAISEALDERVTEIESSEGRDVGRAERRRLREQIVTEMLPRAFTRSRRTRLYIDTQAGWIVVDAASDKQAEEVLSLLRETLGSLPVTPPDPASDPAGILTRWLLEDDAPGDFVPGDGCALRDGGERGGVIRCRGQDLASDEILNHLRAGKRVEQLDIEWDDHLSFTLTDELALKRLRLAEAALEALDAADEPDPAQRLDSEFTLLALQMRELIARLDALFGLAPAAA